jgi:hypothetical protein
MKDCKMIEGSNERLKCYDDMASGVRDFEEDWEEIKEKERECADKCSEEDGAWDFSGGECKCRFFDRNDKPRKEGEWNGYDCSLLDCKQGYHCEPDYGCVSDVGGEAQSGSSGGDYEESECKDGCDDECPDASRTDCVDDGTRCQCYYDDNPDDEDNGEKGDYNQEDEEQQQESQEDAEQEDDSENDDENLGEGESNSNDNSEESIETIITGNVFLNYFN